MRLIYNVVLTIVVAAMLPKFIKRLISERGFAERFRQSFGVVPRGLFDKVENSNCIWVHAASVGEVVAAAPIIRELRRRHPEMPVLFTVITATGYAMARKLMSDVDCIAYLPLDFFWLSSKMVNKIRPAVFVNIETELWPNLLFYFKKANIPVIMVNGRISNKSVKKYRWIRRFMRNSMSGMKKFCMQSNIDARHIVEIGAAPELVIVTGNTKYEQSYASLDEAGVAQMKAALGIEGRAPLFIAGSTYAGEEELLIGAFGELSGKYPAAVMIMAPRKIDRADEIVELCIHKGFTAIRKTRLSVPHSAQIIVLDTIGELGQLYGLADFVYVGGSLIERGGHNILEPAAHGKAIITGHNTFNFAEIHALMKNNNACVTVNDGQSLTEAVASLAENDVLRNSYAGNARRVIRENSGAAARSVDEIEKVLRDCRKK